jgi:hypothetical protein
VGLFVLLRNIGGAAQKVNFFKGIVIVMNNQITFGYRTADRATGITRATAKRLADQLGVDETGAPWDGLCS